MHLFHLDLAGFYFSKFPANSKCPTKFVTRYQLQANLWWRKPKFKYIEFAWAWTRTPHERMLTLYHWAMEAIHIFCLRFYLSTRAHSSFGGFFSIVLAHFLQRSIERAQPKYKYNIMTQDSSCWVGENDWFIWAGNLRPQVPKFSVITGNFQRFLLWKKEEHAWWDQTQYLWITTPVLYP